MAKNREKILAQVNAILALPDEVLESVLIEAHFGAKTKEDLVSFCDAIGTKWREHSTGLIHTDYDWNVIRGLVQYPPGLLGGTHTEATKIVQDAPDLSLVNRCVS